MAGYATPAWSNDQSPAIDDSALLDIGQGIEIAEHPYGVCSTAGTTAAKTVTIDFSGTLTLFTGLTVRVKFTNANSVATPTLDVNSTGAKAIKAFGATDPNVFTWRAGEIVQFTYDGTNWIMQAGASTIGGVGSGILLSSADDLDNIVDTGWYYWTTTVPAHSPTIYGYGSMYVDHAGSNIKQTVFRDNKEYTRNKYGPNAWPAWAELGFVKVALGSKTGTGSSVTWSKSDAAITANHVVIAYELGAPGAQTGDLTWTTSAGAISVSGNINGTTTLTVVLGIVGTSVT